MPAIERITIKLPAGFDPGRHVAALAKLVADKHGDGFEIDSIDPVIGIAYATRQAAITEVSAAEHSEDSFEMRLPRGTKPSDGERVATKMQDQYPGFYVTRFEPFLGKAVLSRLDDATARCRGAVSVALGVKPWEVRVRPRPDGGFCIELPRTYVPSKHDDKLAEVATTVVGRDGWYVDADPNRLTAEIIPSSPPSFPAAFKYPMNTKVPPFALDKTEWAKIPLGHVLPPPGQDVGPVFYLDLLSGAHGQVGGVSGGGKASSLDSRIPVPVSDRFPTGWALNRELDEGDQVYAADGTVTTILGFSEVRDDHNCFEVVLDTGQTIQVAGTHLWQATPARARHMHYRDPGRRASHLALVREKATRLRKMAFSVDPGSVATARTIADMAGCDRSYVRTLARVKGIPSEQVVVDALPGGRLESVPRNIRLFMVDAVAESTARREMSERFSCVTSRALASHSGEWLSAREIAVACGVTSPTQPYVNKLSEALTARGVEHKNVNRLATRVVPGRVMSVLAFPVGEVLYALAAAAEGPILPGGTNAVMPLDYIVDTNEMHRTLLVNRGRGLEHNWSIRLPEPFDAVDVELAVDPYVLGVWLGDGSSRCGTIWQGETAACTDENGLTDRAFLVAELRRMGMDAIASDVNPTIISARKLIYGLREINVVQNKHIPPTYLRASAVQRLALLQGLMDTDGSIAPDGGCELCLTNERLVNNALELIRSLGIKASMSSGLASITERDPDNPDCKRRRTVGTRWRIHFTTSQQVFRLPRKAKLIRADRRKTQAWFYVTDIRPIAPIPMRCLRIAHPSHLHLIEDFIPTHNSTLINSFIAGCLARSAELVLVDLPSKSVDFLWCKKFCRPGGWGCDSLAAAVTALAMVMTEGERRAAVLAQHNVIKWTELSASSGMKPIVVIVDELTGLFYPEKVPKLAKDHPLVIEANEINLQKAILEKHIKRIAAEMRFVGIHLLVSSQVASVATGIDPAMRTNLHHKVLMGSKPTDGNRRLVLSDTGRVPKVPANVQADPDASRGTGVAEPEGQEPCVFKSFYASTSELNAWLTARGVPTTERPAPSPAEISKHTPSLDDGVAPPRSGTADDDYGYDDGTRIDPETGKVLTGFQKANAARHQLTVDARAAATAKTSQVVSTDSPTQTCSSCGRPIDPSNGTCACSR